MADNEVPAGASAFDNGGGAEAGKAIGKVSVNSQAAIDSSAFKELNKEFKALSGHVTKFKQDLPTLIADTKKWATELGKVAKQMKSIGDARKGGGGGSSYLPDAGSGTNIGSGNVTNVYKSVTINEGGGGGGGPDLSPAGKKSAAWDAIKDLAGSALNAMDARAARGAEYSLSADKMNMLYQQTTGLSQNQVYHQYREPLQGYKLGMGGINTLLGLQARTGLNARQQAGSVEAMRAASGYAYSTEQIAGMTQSLATPESTNQMFMMLGTGMYGIGGKQRTQQQVFQDIINRTGLTNEKMVQGAFQQGSMTRARLSMAGLAEDQQDLLLQYAQQNIAYKKKGGQGFYDPSKKSQRELMGVEGNYANQAEETARVQANREENFYKRQNDNFAQFEKATQNVTKALQAFEEKLSGIAGANISTKPYRSAGSTLFSWGKKIVGAGMMVAGALGAAPTFGGSLALTAGGAGLMASGGDPVDGLMRRRRGVWGVRGNNELGGDATPPDQPAEAKLSANNKNKLAQLDPKLREPLKKMLLANPKLEIGDARRSGARQETSFRKRYSKAPAGVTKKTKDADRIWNGEVWIYDKHAENGPPMAAPGQSMHEIGLAADLSQSENEWIRANAANFGLSHGGTQKGAQTDEPFHVQPAGIPFGRAEYEGQSGTSTSPTGTTVTAGVADSPNAMYPSGGGEMSGGSRGGSVSASATSAGLPSSYTFQYSGMSMGEVIGSGSVYAKGTIPAKTNPSSSYPSASAGGDATVPSPLMPQTTQASNSFNITIAPNLTVQSTGNVATDVRRLAKDVADILEKEVKLKMMRIS